MTSADKNNPSDASLWRRVRSGPPGEALDANVLAAYVDGRLDEQARAEVEAQLAADPRARQALAEVRALLGAPAMAPSADVPARAKALVRRRGGLWPRAKVWLGGTGASRWKVALQSAGALAAAVLIGLAGYFAGVGTYRNRQQADAAVAVEVSFDPPAPEGEAILPDGDIDALLAINTEGGAP